MIKPKSIFKFLSALLCLPLLAAGIPASAAENLKLTSTYSSVSAGETGSFKVGFANNSMGIASIHLYITYDPDVITPVSFTLGESFEEGMIEDSIGGDTSSIHGLPANTVQATWISIDNVYGDCEFVDFNFDVKDSAYGSTHIKVWCNEDDTFRWTDSYDEEFVNPDITEFDIPITTPYDNLPFLKLSCGDIKAGETAQVVGTLSRKQTLSSAVFSMQYDPSAFVCKDIESVADISNVTDSNGVFTFKLSNIGKVSDNGEMFRIKLQSRNNAAAKTYPIGMTASGIIGVTNMRVDGCSFKITKSATSGALHIYSSQTLTADMGNSVEVPVYISNNPGICATKVVLNYDPTILIATKVTDPKLFSRSLTTNISAANGKVYINYTSPDAKSENGKLCSVTFTVLSDEVRDYEIEIVAPEGDTVDDNNTAYPTLTANAKISLNSSIVDALDIEGSTLSLHNNMALNFMLDKTTAAAYSDLALKVTFNGETTTINEYTEDDDYYIFKFADISPDRLADKMTVQASGRSNGKEYKGNPIGYSVLNYCRSILSSYSSDQYSELRTLVVDILNYGAAAQEYSGHNTGALANASLSAVQKSWASPVDNTIKTVSDVAYSTVSSPSAEWQGGMRLILGNSITAEMTFKTADKSGTTVVIKNEAGDVLARIGASQYSTVTVSGQTVYSVDFRNIIASEMKDSFYATVYRGNTAISNTMRFSVESYAYEAKRASSDEKLGKLLDTMIQYGNSAKAYTNV